MKPAPRARGFLQVDRPRVAAADFWGYGLDMRRVLLLETAFAFLQVGCGPVFTVDWFPDSGADAAGTAIADSASASVDKQAIGTAAKDAEAEEETGSAPADPLDAEASIPDAAICTAIPFQARSSCPTASTGCGSCSDPLLYVPGNFWLGCSSQPTPPPCQCAETYDCACLLKQLSPSCKGTLLCDPSPAAPALFLRCVPGPDL